MSWEDGNLTISRITSNGDRERVRIALELQNGERVKVECSLEEFAAAVTGRGFVPMKFQLRRRLGISKAP